MSHFGEWLVTRLVAPVVVWWSENIWGWHMAERFPDIPKYLFVAEYHTSNWDVMVLLYTAAKERRRVRFIIKQEARDWLLVGPFLGWAGAVFIDRDAPLTAIKTIMRTMRNAETAILLICPSGTRRYSEGWQPGFYYLAEKLKLPIVPASPDYNTKQVRIAPAIIPSGDIHADLALMADFYVGMGALIPERATPVRLMPAASEGEKAAVPLL
jgi:1-acyl-sn-glycerol-3-phosphate acyltransferase